MEKLAHSIASKIAVELNYDNDKKEIISYGTFALLQMIISIFLVIIIGYKFNVLKEALIISFSTSILRKYSGGVHASSPGRCMFVGTVVCIGQALLATFVLKPYINLIENIAVGVVTFLWAYYIVIKLAPVDSSAKPIKNEEKRKRMKRGSILLLNIYITFSILNIILYLITKDGEFLVYCLCISLGVLWQIFTLTKAGCLTLKVIDTSFNYTFKLLGKGRIK